MKGWAHRCYGGPDIVQYEELPKPVPAAVQIRAVIDRTYQFSDVPEVIRYLETGRAPGKVVIRFE